MFTKIIVYLYILFIKTTVQYNVETITEGEMISLSNNTIYMRVTNPVNQYMQIYSDSLIVYYPDEEIAHVFQYETGQYNNQDLLMLEIPDSVSLYNLGMRKYSQRMRNDTLIIQYLPIDIKKTQGYPLITIYKYRGLTSEIISSISPRHYSRLRPIEYTKWENKDIMKKYSIRNYWDGELLEETVYSILELRKSTIDDSLRMVIKLPKTVKIEHHKY